MEKPIIESKGTGKIVIITGLVFVILAFFLFVLLGENIFEGDEFIEQIASILPFILPLSLGAFLIAFGIRFSKTKISVYNDHIEGTCVVDKLNRDFYLKYEKISNISVDNGVLLIQSDSVTHKISLSAKNAGEIAKFINNKL